MVSRIARILRRHQENEHSDIHKLASDYLDAELDEDKAANVKSHLDMCPPCAAFIETLRTTIRLLSTLGKEKA